MHIKKNNFKLKSQLSYFSTHVGNIINMGLHGFLNMISLLLLFTIIYIWFIIKL